MAVRDCLITLCNGFLGGENVSMTGSSQFCVSYAGPLSIKVVRACLVQLGWRIDVARRQTVAASYGEGAEFSAIICCLDEGNTSRVIVRVESNASQSECACRKEISRLLEALTAPCKGLD
jgi:hypothetical protein